MKPKTSNKKKPKKSQGGSFLSGRRPFSRQQALALMLVLVAVGGYIIYRSFADTGGTITADNCFNCDGSNGASKFTENANSKNSFTAIALSSGAAGSTENFLVMANGFSLDPGVYSVCLNLKSSGNFGGNMTAQPLASVMNAKTISYISPQTNDYAQLNPCLQNVQVTAGGGGMAVTLTNISGSGGPTVDVASATVIRTGDLPATPNWPPALNPMALGIVTSTTGFQAINRNIYGTVHYLTKNLGVDANTVNSNLNYTGPTDYETANTFPNGWTDHSGAGSLTIPNVDTTTTPGAGTMTGVPAIGDPYIDSLNFYAMATCESGSQNGTKYWGGYSRAFNGNDTDGGGYRTGAFQNSDWAWHWGGDYQNNPSADPYPHAWDAPLWYQYYRNKRIFLKELVYGPTTGTAYRYPPETGHLTCGPHVFDSPRPDSERIY